MNCETTIQVAALLGKTIHTRNACNHLLQVLAADHLQQIELDFSGVDYISRSFADQFHAGKRKLAAEHQKSIIVTNANTVVVNMLQAVAKTQNKTNAGIASVPVYKYSNWRDLENFLLSV